MSGYADLSRALSRVGIVALSAVAAIGADCDRPISVGDSDETRLALAGGATTICRNVDVRIAGPLGSAHPRIFIRVEGPRDEDAAASFDVVFAIEREGIMLGGVHVSDERPFGDRSFELPSDFERGGTFQLRGHALVVDREREFLIELETIVDLPPRHADDVDVVLSFTEKPC